MYDVNQKEIITTILTNYNMWHVVISEYKNKKKLWNKFSPKSHVIGTLAFSFCAWNIKTHHLLSLTWNVTFAKILEHSIFEPLHRINAISNYVT